MGTWFTGGFCTGLRGEEMVRIEFAGTAKTVDKYVYLKLEPDFMFVVTGRSKGNQLSGAKFSVPCVGTTEEILFAAGSLGEETGGKFTEGIFMVLVGLRREGQRRTHGICKSTRT
jgi:hypothetical protein